MTTRRWQFIQPQPDLVRQISGVTTLSPLIVQILLNRNIRSIDGIHSFLSPTIEPLGTLDLPDLPIALAIIQQAIQNQTPILVYGDYDVDGMTSTSIMVDVLRKLGASVMYYLPNRFKEGYGLTHDIIPTMLTHQIGLLITLDCGITNVSEIQAIKSQTQATVLVLDHHTIPDPLPPADAIVNPKALPPHHPLYLLCTAGLVYHVVMALVNMYGYPIHVPDYLDLVALGTIADVVPLIDENRRLVFHGLPKLSAKNRLGVRVLLDVAGFSKSLITTRDVGFVIAPRLNAAGRLASAMMGVKLLLSTDPTEALEVARTLQQMNEDRQAIGISMLQESIQQAKMQVPHQKVIVVHGVNWHSGVIGITASRLVEQFNRPVIMIAEKDGVVRGSARTTGSVNVYELLASCQGHFQKFGGHREAAGFSLLPEQVDGFRADLYSVANQQIQDQDLSPIIRIDATISPSQLTLAFAEELSSLAPFGQGNPAPIWYCNQLKPVEFKRVGSGDHLKLTLIDATGKIAIDAIGFGLGPKITHCYQASVELVFTLEINEWRGNVLPQLQLLDIR